MKVKDRLSGKQARRAKELAIAYRAQGDGRAKAGTKAASAVLLAASGSERGLGKAKTKPGRRHARDRVRHQRTQQAKNRIKRTRVFATGAKRREAIGRDHNV